MPSTESEFRFEPPGDIDPECRDYFTIKVFIGQITAADIFFNDPVLKGQGYGEVIVNWSPSTSAQERDKIRKAIMEKTGLPSEEIKDAPWIKD